MKYYIGKVKEKYPKPYRCTKGGRIKRMYRRRWYSDKRLWNLKYSAMQRIEGKEWFWRIRWER